MKLLRLQKVKDGKYLKNYELTYLNKKGKEKVYEIVSRNDIPDTEIQFSLDTFLNGLPLFDHPRAEVIDIVIDAHPKFPQKQHPVSAISHNRNTADTFSDRLSRTILLRMK